MSLKFLAVTTIIVVDKICGRKERVAYKRREINRISIEHTLYQFFDYIHDSEEEFNLKHEFLTVDEPELSQR